MHGYSASTISREVMLNTQQKSFESQNAQRAFQLRRISSRLQCKLNTESILFGFVYTHMHSRWSPEQINCLSDKLIPRATSLQTSWLSLHSFCIRHSHTTKEERYRLHKLLTKTPSCQCSCDPHSSW